ncbi:ABC transporter permease [Streptomyces sp. NP160]|uniref:ABC transporter permease n=1 Tax=Streptomyces sp. NP160 TaxID=2586637 RepID=UPI00111B2B6C|nr:ABC transporter permease [Streptomyces sp. NP160]TNM68114.1 ABC transporter permease [Streptomyces sp. NP160]
MVAFVLRRLLISIGVFFVATFLMYVLVANAGDPLEDLYGITDPGDRAARIASRTEIMQLNTPVVVRYLHWLGDLVGYLWGSGSLGVNRTGQAVAPLLGLALSSTLRLVLLSTVLAIVTGIAVGIVSALRQYTSFDYTLTFFSFVFYSLPIFWAAVLLKQFGAIAFNDWLGDPVVPLPVLLVLAVVGGLFGVSLVGGRTWAKRGLAFAGGFLVVAAVLLVVSQTDFLARPTLGPVGVSVLGLAAAVGVTALVSGLAARRVLIASLAGAVVGIVIYVATVGVLADPTWPLLLGLFAVTLVVAGGIGAGIGGIDRSRAVRAAVLSAAVVAALSFVDWLMYAWPDYVTNSFGRPIATIGSNTPNFDGTLWQTTLDTLTHLVLPSVTLVLISFAQYTRYTRSSMLETMNQDYVRTARAKGLTERTVIMRHAFRNALIPVTTLVALDFAAVVGGAVITERIFGWQGMGTLFLGGVQTVDPPPVMAFFIVAAAAVLLLNIVADLVYAYLDPRIRLS